MALSNVLQLDQPIQAGGIRAVNFFNGRLLASNDLTREQDARREGDKRLGAAFGEGVATGLEVSLNATLSAPGLPVAHVSAGLAVNRVGQAIRLAVDVDVALARQFDPGASGVGFASCTPTIGGSYVAGAGVYVLTVAPASAAEGRATTNGLDPANVRCNTDATVEAVAFRLLIVRPDLYAGLPVGTPAFRNALAYRCFGSGVQPDWLARVFNAADRDQALLAQLRPNVMTDAEVPIALLFFTGAATLEFIDAWSVRRPIAPPPASFPPAALADQGRKAIGRAMFLQFQAQVAELAPPVGGLGAVTARSHFRYLPPVGIVPAANEADATDMQATAFFAGMTYRSPVFINAAAVEPLLNESLLYPPINTQGGEMVWLYRVRENRMAIDGAAGPAPRGYIVFASAPIPYRGDAQFDLSSFGYANVARAG